jgi:hypothetical protein
MRRDALMKNGTIVLALVIGALAFADPASAQNAVGGPKKPIAVGGAAKQNSPVMPANKGGSSVVSTPSKCPTGSCVVKGAK